MAQVIVVQRMWQRRDTAENWTARNPVLADGEIGFERDVPTTYVKMKVGDGSTPWNDLDYFASGTAGGGSWIVGSGVPDDGLGDNGSLYLDSVTGDVYQKEDDTWGSPVANIKGPAGEDSTVPGPPGPAIEMRVDGGYIQWRVVGEPTWTDLVPLAYISGTDGREVELQKGTTHIQWRYVGDLSWTDLISIAEITGPAGADALGAVARATVTLASGQGTAAVGKTALLLKLVATAEARIRFYGTAAARTADASRAANVAPPQGAGLLLEFISVPTLLGAPLTPGVIATNLDTPPTGVIYYNIQPVGGAMSVDLTYLKLES